MQPEDSAPLSIGYVAPTHGSGGMGFLLLAFFALIVLLGGAVSTNPGVTLIGVGALALAAAGYFVYWQRAKTWPLVALHADRLEFRRGPQKGVLPFAEVTGVHMLQWERSLFPYSRGHRVLVLESPAGEWQVGVEIAEHQQFQEAVLAALRAFGSS